MYVVVFACHAINHSLRCNKLTAFHIIQQANCFVLQSPPLRPRRVLAAEGSHVSGPPYAGPSSKPILNSIQSPSDMNSLTLKELKQVS